MEIIAHIRSKNDNSVEKQPLSGTDGHLEGVAVLAESFRSIKKMTPALYESAKKALTRLRETANLSDTTREIVGKILDA